MIFTSNDTQPPRYTAISRLLNGKNPLFNAWYSVTQCTSKLTYEKRGRREWISLAHVSNGIKEFDFDLTSLAIYIEEEKKRMNTSQKLTRAQRETTSEDVCLHFDFVLGRALSGSVCWLIWKLPSAFYMEIFRWWMCAFTNLMTKFGTIKNSSSNELFKIKFKLIEKKCHRCGKRHEKNKKLIGMRILTNYNVQ